MIKYFTKIQLLPFFGTLSILLTVSCSDDWNNHYDQSSFNLPDKTVYGSIKENPELSIFLKMVEKSGFDKVLNTSQSYTVWAPTNDALNTIDTTDTDLVLKIVTNHIARNKYTTSGNDLIPVVNGKYINMTTENGSFTFGGQVIIKKNLTAKNGLVHEIEGYVPYIKNLWEYIGIATGLDSLRNYLYSQTDSVFDPANSIEIGINSQGQTIYTDSAFIIVNKILEKIGSITSEDSSFTLLMPDNTAWNEAYTRTKKYFNFSDIDGAGLRKKQMAQYTIVKDMVFRDNINDASLYDSLVSSIGNVFYNPAGLFANYQLKESLSNGLGYVVSQMPYNDTLSWFKEIRVEAEDTAGRSKSSNLFERTSYGTGYKASNNKYLLVDPTTSGSKVKFSIPNTLSGKYNIYCVFVPYSIVDTNIQIPTKANFILTYIRRKAGGTFSMPVTVQNNITSPNKITKMLVTQFNFEFANIIDEEYPDVKVKLEVLNAVTTDEEKTGNFMREMRIDCIILEPVLE